MVSCPTVWRQNNEEPPLTVRPPSLYSQPQESLLGLLDHEIMAEKASALGRAGERVERTLGILRAAPADLPGRHALLMDAADAVYAYFVQREVCGMRRHHDVIREYAIPNEVLVRLGAR